MLFDFQENIKFMAYKCRHERNTHTQGSELLHNQRSETTEYKIKKKYLSTR